MLYTKLIVALSKSFSFFFCGMILCCAVMIISCTTKTESAQHTVSSTKFDQYYLQGEQLFQKNCSNCHQKTGTGLGLVYPPVNKSDFIDNHFEEVICLMKNGKNGELIVNGKNFNKAMPAIPSLTNLEVAEIATYLYNTWERKKGLIDVKAIDSLLTKCNSN
ncbi:MAG TPA: cytochrome c [Cyclobacteriaceae bacterium]|jgi:mono/diheme cytochrome c family protein|nr:cytochrome c [Cyclobacteriaceae bacterium]